MVQALNRSSREPRRFEIQFAAGARLPNPELPHALAVRAEQALKQMKELEAQMADPELSIEKLERCQARLVRWAEHIQWLAGGTLETQVQELKSLLLSLGSGPSSERGGAELAVWALAGSPQGAQLGLRLWSRNNDQLRKLAGVGLLSSRNAHVIDQILQHLHDRSDHLVQGLTDCARQSGSALLGLGAIGEFLASRDFESLELPGAPVISTLDHVQRLQSLPSSSNPIIRAAVVRAVAYAALGSPEFGEAEELKEWFKGVVSNDSELRVKFRAIAAIPAFNQKLRAELVHAAFSAGPVELHIPALRYAAGLKHKPLNNFLLKRYLKLIETESSGPIPEVHALLADSLRGNIAPALEGRLHGLVMDPNCSPRRKVLALRALNKASDQDLQDRLLNFVKDWQEQDLACAAAETLQRSCTQEAQLELVQAAVDQNLSGPARINAMRALPNATGADAQAELVALLPNEDEQALLDEVVAAFQRFDGNHVRGELRALVANGTARENGRSAAITILGARCDYSELQLIRPQLKDGAFPCRLAAAELLCHTGLNGVENRSTMALLTQSIKESVTGNAPVDLERLGRACNHLLRTTGML